MIFKSYSEAASLLAQKIHQENFSDISLVYINPESKTFAELVANQLNLSLILLSDPQYLILNTKYLILIDIGSTNSVEYNEFTDKIRKTYPSTKIILAIPVIPESEKTTLESVCDTLIYLHSDPYFFSLSQFFPLK
ncbi:MAG: hypothetical protein AAB574_02530 [Patescibacteria group bacterium]